MRLLQSLVIIALAATAALAPAPSRAEQASTDLFVDGVPLPVDIAPLSDDASPFAGTWVGNWDGRLNTALAVEAVAEDGRAKVVYAVAEQPGVFGPAWRRYDAKIDGNTLTVFGQYGNIHYTLSPTGRMRAVFGDGFGFAVLTRAPLATLLSPNPKIPWDPAETIRLRTPFKENGAPVTLETFLYTPPGEGPFPLAVVNHGSTGTGDLTLAKQSWSMPFFADVLNARGYIVAFPQRRGRGASDGLYDEGLSQDRTGYTCEASRSLAGATRALRDLNAAIVALAARPDVAAVPILLAGTSRGGLLSLAYAGAHPVQIAGVINFVGGWMSSDCPNADDINQTLFRIAAAYDAPTLWLYGADDTYYAKGVPERYFADFTKNGGQGTFEELTVRGENNGHWVMSIPPLWSPPVAAYLDTLPGATR